MLDLAPGTPVMHRDFSIRSNTCDLHLEPLILNPNPQPPNPCRLGFVGFTVLRFWRSIGSLVKVILIGVLHRFGMKQTVSLPQPPVGEKLRFRVFVSAEMWPL